MATDQSLRDIFFLNWGLGGGGAERGVLDNLLHLNPDCFRPTLFTVSSQDDYGLSLPHVRRIVCNRALTVSLTDLLREAPPFFRSAGEKTYLSAPFEYYAALVDSVRSAVRNARLPVIVSNIWNMNLAASMIRHQLGVDVPLVLVEHHDPLELRNHFSPDIFLRLKEFMREAYSRADAVVAVSDRIRRCLVDDVGVPSGKIRVIYNGLPLEKIEKSMSESVDHPWFDGSVPIVISVGRLEEIKNPRLFLEAFAILRKRMKARLALMGKGSLEPMLRQSARELGVAEDVWFAGFQSNVCKFLSRANVFVMSSRSEACPISMLEAMACGLPVVSRRWPGVEEFVEEGKNGFISETDDAAALAGKMEKVLSGPDLAARLGREARQGAQRFRMDRVMKEYEDVYRNTTSSGNGREVTEKSFGKPVEWDTVPKELVGKRVAVFGAGGRGKEFARFGDRVRIEYYVDNDVRKHGRFIEGKEIHPSSRLGGNDYDALVLATYRWDEAFEQVKPYGVGVSRGAYVFIPGDAL